MSHGIQKYDRGYVGQVRRLGNTWHGIPSYKQIDEWVSDEQALEVLTFPIERRQLLRTNQQGIVEPTDVFEAYRPDTGSVLAPAITESYDLTSNDQMFRMVKESIIGPNKDIHIESVGTLFNGQTCFLNLMLDSFEIPGDESPQYNRLMYYNPLGKGSYRAAVHNVRVVCNNTLQAASAQGAANKTLRKVRHTKNAQDKLRAELEELGAVYLGLKQHREVLIKLTTLKFDNDLIRAVASKNLFLSKPSKKSINNAVDRWQEVYENTLGEYSAKIRDSRYVALQAFTNMIDAKGRKSDEGYRKWDGLVGSRARMKDGVFSSLVKA